MAQEYEIYMRMRIDPPARPGRELVTFDYGGKSQGILPSKSMKIFVYKELYALEDEAVASWMNDYTALRIISAQNGVPRSRKRRLN